MGQFPLVDYLSNFDALLAAEPPPHDVCFVRRARRRQMPNLTELIFLSPDFLKFLVNCLDVVNAIFTLPKAEMARPPLQCAGSLHKA